MQPADPQPDRPDDPVPIVPFIDEKLHENQGDGYRYESLPPQRDAWRIGLRAIDEEARAHWQRGFRELPDNLKDAVLRSVQHGDTLSEAWQGMPAKQFQERARCTRRSASDYAHPAAWSEIGFRRTGRAARLCSDADEPARPVGGDRGL